MAGSLGELTALPRLASWIWGTASRQGRGWAGEEEGKGRQGEVEGRERENGRDGTGHGMGRKRERRKGREREERGYSPPTLIPGAATA